MLEAYPLTAKQFIDHTSFVEKECEKADSKAVSTLKHVENSILALSILSTFAFLAPFVASHFIKIPKGILYGVGFGVPFGLGMISFGLGFLATAPKKRIDKALLLQQAADLQRGKRKTHTFTPLSDTLRLDEERPFTTKEMMRPRTTVDKRLYTDALKDPDKEKEIPLRGIQNTLDALGVEAPSPFSYLADHGDIHAIAKQRHEALYSHLSIAKLPESIGEENAKIFDAYFQQVFDYLADEKKHPTEATKFYFELREWLMKGSDLMDALAGSPVAQRTLMKKTSSLLKERLQKCQPEQIKDLFEEMILVFKRVKEERESGAELIDQLHAFRAFIYAQVTAEADFCGIIDKFTQNPYLQRSVLFNKARALVEKLKEKIELYPFLQNEIQRGERLALKGQELFLASESETKTDKALETWVVKTRVLIAQINKYEKDQQKLKIIKSHKEWKKIAPKDVTVPTKEIRVPARKPLEYIRDQLSSKKCEASKYLEEINKLTKGLELPENEAWAKKALGLIKTLSDFCALQTFEIPKRLTHSELVKLFYKKQTLIYREISPALIAARNLLAKESPFRTELRFLTPEGVQKHFQDEVEDIANEAKLKFLSVLHKNFSIDQWKSFAGELAESVGKELWFGRDSLEKAKAFFNMQTHKKFFRATFKERLRPHLKLAPLEVFEKKLPKGYDQLFLDRWTKKLKVELKERELGTLSALFAKIKQEKPQTWDEYNTKIHLAITKPLLNHYMVTCYNESFKGIDTTAVDKESPKQFQKLRRRASVSLFNNSKRVDRTHDYAMIVLGLIAAGTGLAAILVKNRAALLACQLTFPVSVLGMMGYTHYHVHLERKLKKERLYLQNIETGKLYSRTQDPKLDPLDLANESLLEEPLFSYESAKKCGKYEPSGFKTNPKLSVVVQAHRLAFSQDPYSGVPLRDELGVPLPHKKIDAAFIEDYKKSEHYNEKVLEELLKHYRRPL
jgi:hypothetical protein